MIDYLGFKVEVLFTSKFKINARDVEDALQKRFQSLPLGFRLWRKLEQNFKFQMGMFTLLGLLIPQRSIH
jgi:hypothetical protein